MKQKMNSLYMLYCKQKEMLISSNKEQKEEKLFNEYYLQSSRKYDEFDNHKKIITLLDSVNPHLKRRLQENSNSIIEIEPLQKELLN